MQSNTTNTLISEIILGVVAGLMAIAAPVLLYLGTIDFSGALAVWGIAAGVVVGKLALNAPSPAQQAQLNAQQQTLQQLLAPVLSALPGVLQALQGASVPAQVQQTSAPVTPPQATLSSGVVAQSPVAPAPPPQQFKAPVAQAVMEHPPIEPGQMVNTFPNLPAIAPQAQP